MKFTLKYSTSLVPSKNRVGMYNFPVGVSSTIFVSIGSLQSTIHEVPAESEPAQVCSPYAELFA